MVIQVARNKFTPPGPTCDSLPRDTAAVDPLRPIDETPRRLRDQPGERPDEF